MYEEVRQKIAYLHTIADITYRKIQSWKYFFVNICHSILLQLPHVCTFISASEVLYQYINSCHICVFLSVRQKYQYIYSRHMCIFLSVQQKYFINTALAATWVYFYQCDRSTLSIHLQLPHVCIFTSVQPPFVCFNSVTEVICSIQLEASKMGAFFYQCGRNSFQAFCKVAKLVLDTLCKMMRSCFGRHYCIADEGKCNMQHGGQISPPHAVA